MYSTRENLLGILTEDTSREEKKKEKRFLQSLVFFVFSILYDWLCKKVYLILLVMQKGVSNTFSMCVCTPALGLLVVYSSCWKYTICNRLLSQVDLLELLIPMGR